MRDLIEKQLYNPSVVLPMVALMEMLVFTDFSLGRVGLMVATRGAQAALTRSREFICAHHHSACH
ncbi:hypothetical protein AAHK20_01600 [Trinickia sp. YCB016]